MKIAVATKDQKNITTKHFGQSPYFIIFEILNGELCSTELRTNPYTEKHGRTDEIIELLDDCEMYMGKTMGKDSLDKLAEHNIEVIVSEIDDANEAVNAYLLAKDEYFQYYNGDKKQMVSCLKR